MFRVRHFITVKPARGGRKYVYECSCGARGWETDSSYASEQMGRDHAAKAAKKGK
ncbi:hypothetical protein [Streptomyces cadmiisoli]|uniref:hypothetical protein n=1 Tax=Streptomyces cadmiisoli TaxID=2184053 RepID=UPI003653D7E6